MTFGLDSFGRTLVIAPHPDDEILGAGGTIARLARAGMEVTVAVVTSGRPPAYSAAQVARVRHEAEQAHRALGVRETLWLGQPAAELSETPHAALNAAIRGVIADLDPATLLVPFVGDIHRDHQLTFLSALVAARPHQAKFPATILAYETLSETNWNAPYLSPGFQPNVFIDISNTLQLKLDAMEMFASQLRDFPHERSAEALKALAMLRGAAVHCHAAEAFVLVRHVVRAPGEESDRIKGG
ncbi:PIG-L deacetylase family protein [Rhodoligotrophos defluvii]|uniref:PIG-L deacetylase family protein n=1 Tax=Rhodoligotrophos defluvii TaxID=2561934 RepID=UPI0010C9E234|nr:PIG-L deacetylase family protein [Rhodoligotrophos defluvii]